MSDSVVIIPTYNEKENIENIIRAVFNLEKDFHILVIDDGSPDGTATIVHNLIRSEYADRLFIEERKGKLGLGTAYIHGFKWALAHSYEYIFEMDADFSHNPQDLPRLYAACAVEGFDVSIGSRYSTGVNVLTGLGSRADVHFASKYVQFITEWIFMTQRQFCLLSRKVLETMDLDRIKFKGYASRSK
jgi:dolichol-phosphate mannosyltransferase